MTESNTNPAKAPDLLQDTDLLKEFGGSISGRTTPSSFRESPIGWGMSLICGGMGFSTIDSRDALVNYYNESTFASQREILTILANTDKENRLGLFAKAMFHACSKNFVKKHAQRNSTQSALIMFNDIDTFNAANNMKESTKKYKLSSVQDHLAGRNSQMVVDMILNVCGAMGMPYDAMSILLNKPELVYASFKSTFGANIVNQSTNRGYALWVMYAAARQCYSNATSYVVDDMFYIDVHSHNGQDEDIDQVLNELGIFAEINPGLVGYELRKIEEKFCFVPDKLYVDAKFKNLVSQAAKHYWEENPQELIAHLLQLTYVLNPFEEEFSAMLGLTRSFQNFAPDINCIDGPVPASIKDLTLVHDNMGQATMRMAHVEQPNFTRYRHDVSVLATSLVRTQRHLLRHAREKSWYIDGPLLSLEQKGQMRKTLYDLMLETTEVDWGSTHDDNGWLNTNPN